METSLSALVGLLDYQLVHQLEQVRQMYLGAGKEWVIREDDLGVGQEVKLLVGKIVQLM